jgi:hypothetical protein
MCNCNCIGQCKYLVVENDVLMIPVLFKFCVFYECGKYYVARLGGISETREKIKNADCM